MRLIALLLLCVAVLASAAAEARCAPPDCASVTAPGGPSVFRSAFGQQGYAPQTYGSQTWSPQSYAPQTYTPHTWSPQVGEPQGQSRPRRRLVRCVMSSDRNDYCVPSSDRELRRGSPCVCDGYRGVIH